jgi:hypothetical protein
VLPAYRSAVGKPMVFTKGGESYCARDESPTLVFSAQNIVSENSNCRVGTARSSYDSHYLAVSCIVLVARRMRAMLIR